MKPPAKAAEVHGRQTLAALVDRFGFARGNWEVDCPESVQPILAMASGQQSLDGRFVGVAGDSDCVCIEVAVTEAKALELLAAWASDEHNPKCPLALADLHTGQVHEVRVTVTRRPGPPIRIEEVRSCQLPSASSTPRRPDESSRS